jgi:hypothetical protein
LYARLASGDGLGQTTSSASFWQQIFGSAQQESLLFGWPYNVLAKGAAHLEIEQSLLWFAKKGCAPYTTGSQSQQPIVLHARRGAWQGYRDGSDLSCGMTLSKSAPLAPHSIARRNHKFFCIVLA